VSVWQDVLNEFAIDLCSFKHPSFFEEKEFRIVRVLLYSNGEYSDVGGHTDVGGSGRVPTKTRFRGSEEISYIELPRDENRQATMIAEVIMGPNNVEAPDVTRTRVESAGYHNFVVKKSFSTYR
jgi:hypothetical protein